MIRIGSRESDLALWQAEKVKALLKAEGLESEIIKIKSRGDIILDKPLYELGISGVFTKTLDIALLNNDIDLAVHSMKDVPTLLPKGISEFAVLERGETRDIVAFKDCTNSVVATGSLRRKAQWLHRNPTHEIVGLRGNVNTRLHKLDKSSWHGAIFAKSGLERLGLLPDEIEVLDWMVPAPAQGAIMIVGRSKDSELRSNVGVLNHTDSCIAVSIERAFLRELEGGCTAPIGAIAEVSGNKVKFTAVLNSLDGAEELRVKHDSDVGSVSEGCELGKIWARELLSQGGAELMEDIKAHFKKPRILSTKVLSADLGTLVRKNGGDYIEKDFIRIEAKGRAEDLCNSVAHNVVMISSKNAIASISNNEQLQGKEILCVGEKTKNAIEQICATVSHKFDTSSEMAAHAVKNGYPATFICGERRMPQVEEAFKQASLELQIIETYSTHLTPEKIEGDLNAVIFYSPSGVESFFSKNLDFSGRAICIGSTTEKEARKHTVNTAVSNTSTIESAVEKAIETILK